VRASSPAPKTRLFLILLSPGFSGKFKGVPALAKLELKIK